MAKNKDNEHGNLEKEKLKLEIEQLKRSKIKFVIIQSITTVVATFLILGFTWFINREYISLTLDVKRLKSEKEYLEIELKKDSLSLTALKYLDSAKHLKKQVEIRDLKSRASITSQTRLTETQILNRFNKAIEKYYETNNSGFLKNEYLMNLYLIEEVNINYFSYSQGGQVIDSLNYYWKNNKSLWEEIVPKLNSFGRINSKTSRDSINKNIKRYKALYDKHYDMMRNYWVNDSTGIIEISKVIGVK